MIYRYAHVHIYVRKFIFGQFTIFALRVLCFANLHHGAIYVCCPRICCYERHLISPKIYKCKTDTMKDRLAWFARKPCHTIYTIICLKSFVIRKLQVAILARSPREMSQTDRIVWKHILSRVRVLVMPRICFIREKKTKHIVNTESPACCLFQWITDRPLSRQRRKRCAQPWRTDWAHRYSEQRRSWVGVGVCVFASVSVCARACVHACVRDVFAIYDSYILPRLIMIIIKIIILYFIQIRHIADFS